MKLEKYVRHIDKLELSVSVSESIITEKCYNHAHTYRNVL